MDIGTGESAAGQSVVQLTDGRALLQMVDDKAGGGQELGIQLLLLLAVGSDRRHERAGHDVVGPE